MLVSETIYEAFTVQFMTNLQWLRQALYQKHRKESEKTNDEWKFNRPLTALVEVIFIDNFRNYTSNY